MSQVGELERELSKLAGARGGLRVHQLFDGASVLLEVVDHEGERHPGARAEGVDENGEAARRGCLEEQRRTARLHDAVGHGGDVQPHVDALAHPLELSALLERPNERAHAVPSHCAAPSKLLSK